MKNFILTFLLLFVGVMAWANNNFVAVSTPSQSQLSKTKKINQNDNRLFAECYVTVRSQSGTNLITGEPVYITETYDLGSVDDFDAGDLCDLKASNFVAIYYTLTWVSYTARWY